MDTIKAVGYRCNSISNVDEFLSVRDVLKYEMFGDEGDKGFRNFDGVLDELKRIIPNCDDHFMEILFESIQTEQLEYDDGYRYNFTDYLIKLLTDICDIPKDCFNYGIWLCDKPQDVVDTYNVDKEDISKYEIEGVLLQDLGKEGKFYGVAEYPEEIIEETTKYIMDFTDNEFEKLYEECVCAGSSSGCGAPISDFVPEKVLGTSLGPNYFMKGKSDVDFPMIL